MEAAPPEAEADAELVPAGEAVAWTQREEAMMRLALEQAVLAQKAGEVPVGCVFVRPGTTEVIAAGHNLTNETGNVSGG